MATKILNWEEEDPEWELIAVITGDRYEGKVTNDRGKKVYKYTYYERLDADTGDQIQYRVCAQVKDSNKLKCDGTITVVIP